MNKERYISHPSDRDDAISEIKDLRYPYLLVTNAMPPEKNHDQEYEKKRKLQAYYYRSIIPTYSRAAGVDETTSRYELQSKFLRCGEIITGSSGEYDVVWIEGEVIEAFEQNKKYIVRSVGDLSVSELIDLVDKSKNFILMRWGVHCPEYQREFKTKEI